MSAAAEKIAAEALALPEAERALLARDLIISLETQPHADAEAETEWAEVIDRRSRDIATGQVACRPVAEVVAAIRSSLHAARRQPS